MFEVTVVVGGPPRERFAMAGAECARHSKCMRWRACRPTRHVVLIPNFPHLPRLPYHGWVSFKLWSHLSTVPGHRIRPPPSRESGTKGSSDRRPIFTGQTHGLLYDHHWRAGLQGDVVVRMETSEALVCAPSQDDNIGMFIPGCNRPYVTLGAPGVYINQRILVRRWSRYTTSLPVGFRPQHMISS